MADGFVCYKEDLPISKSLTDCDLNYSDNINTEIFSMVSNTSPIMNQQLTIVFITLCEC